MRYLRAKSLFNTALILLSIVVATPVMAGIVGFIDSLDMEKKGRIYNKSTIKLKGCVHNEGDTKFLSPKYTFSVKSDNNHVYRCSYFSNKCRVLMVKAGTNCTINAFNCGADKVIKGGFNIVKQPECGIQDNAGGNAVNDIFITR